MNKYFEQVPYENKILTCRSFESSSEYECWNCKNGEKVPTSLECVYCQEIPEVNAILLKGMARLSSNTATLEFKVLKKSFLSRVFLRNVFEIIS